MHFLLAIGIVIIVLGAIYFGFKPVECQDSECWNEKMIECSPANYVNEEPEASWKYEVSGSENNECKIEVTLLMAKEGDLELRAFESHSMDCFYPKGVFAFPDRDLDLCHGRLKEDLQERIISRLHEYILDNLDGIAEGLGA